ncbi:ABC transporter ATP-binding protein [Streptomyces sp. NPDC048297]|uniref:ABC transporter ATP-binding protein n=1 Tax=Streptomyces sp. NPDC048297 TaxID=3365531 RepID=UPI0037105208
MSAACPVPSPCEAVVRAEGLSKTYHGAGLPTYAVRGVDLTVRQGEFVALTGPSGAGKSTLLHLIGGLQRPDSGRLWLDGQRVERCGAARWSVLRRRRIGVMLQFCNLVSHMTVADNIELPALLAGAPPRAAQERRATLVTELGLEGRERSMPGELSGGERQRAALARALVNDPAILLADEPTGTLGGRASREIQRLLSRLHQRGQTIVTVTHDAGLASGADRVVSLFDGRVTDDTRIGDTWREDGRPTRTGVAGVLRLRG